MRRMRAALLLACSWAHAEEIDWAGLELQIETSVLYSPPGSTIQRDTEALISICLLYTSPSPRDGLLSRMPSSA